MRDSQLFGLRLGGYYLVNLSFHFIDFLFAFRGFECRINFRCALAQAGLREEATCYLAEAAKLGRDSDQGRRELECLGTKRKAGGGN